MGSEDHMHISQDFLVEAGVANMTDDFLVSEKGTPDMSVDVAPGTAYVLNNSYSAHSVSENRFWRVILDTSTNVVISANASGNPRYTSLFVKIDTVTTPDDTASNVSSVLAVDGTAAASPTPPATPSDHLRLADVYVANGASSITDSVIVDKRTDASLQARRVTPNLLKNGNFINNSTDGYGGTADDWTNSSGNPVQGGFPTCTKAQLISWLGITDGQIEGLWNLNEASGNAIDLSSNGYDLTETSGTIANSSDGLMDGGARDFELGDTEYFTDTAANTLITGDQTWFAWIKPESLPGDMRIFGHSDSTPTNHGSIRVNSSNGVSFQLVGLTTNSSVSSDVILETGKWYFVCGVYDSGATKLKIWVNGIKVEVTASGSHTVSGTQSLSIGRMGLYNSQYYDGLVNNSGVLSVALNDDQVKALWAHTTYRGTKIRRNSTNGLISQSLPQNLVEQYRGKTLTLNTKMYQETASTVQISIYDGSTETASSTTDVTNMWLNPNISATIDEDATEITLRLKVSTSNGDAWFKECSVSHGGAMVYSPSQDDLNTFPRLLGQETSFNDCVDNIVTLGGWGYLAGDDNADINGVVTFEDTFLDEPIINISFAGSSAGTDYTNLTGVRRVFISHSTQSTTTFKVEMGYSGATFASGTNFFYTWTAKGRI